MEKEQREIELNEALKKRFFETWFNGLPPEEQEKIIPAVGPYALEGPRRGAFINYFEKHVWPEKEKAIEDGVICV